MKIKLLIIALALYYMDSFAQGIYNEGAKILIQSGAVIYITGNYQNETKDTSDGVIILEGVMKLEKNCINNAATGVVLENVSSGEVVFTGSEMQIVGGSNITKFNNLTINKTGGEATLSSNVTIIEGDLKIIAGTLDLGIYTANRSSIGGTLSVSNGATLKIGGTNTFPVNYSTHALGAASTVEYCGANQTVTGETYGNLSLSGNGGTLSGDATVNGTLNLNTDGLITTGSNTLSMGASGTITGNNSSRYVNGKLAISYSGTGSKVFPIGKGGNYRPITFNYSALAGTSTVTAEQIESSLPGSTPANTTLFDSRYWSITESGSTSRAYFVTMDGTGFSPTHTVKMIKGDGSTNTAYDVTSPNYTNVTGFTTISNFGLGEKSSFVLNLKVFLEGAYLGSSAMKTSLQTGNLIPLVQPYTTAPWNYAGTESVSSVPAGVVDWVLVELRDAATPAEHMRQLKLYSSVFQLFSFWFF